jgi:intracellular septation protein
MLFIKALKPILRDFLSTIVFVSIIWFADNIVLATCAGIAVGAIQTTWMLVRHRPIGQLQWLSIVLVAVLGTTTVMTGNGIFFKLKSSLIALALGAVMLRRDWMAPYLPPIIADNLDDRTIIRAGYAWAILFGALAALNLAVALTCSDRVWASFIITVPATSYVALLGTQYLMFRKRILASIRARAKSQSGGVP